jgi:heavy metal translocating P-type ATPase
MQAGMVKRNWFLLISILALTLGFIASEYFFLFGAATGLALSLIWTYRALRHNEFGSDSLAALAIVAATLTGEWIAAAIIALMLASGRALEDWATGKSHRELKSLLDRAPRNAHRIDAKGQLELVTLETIGLGDRIRVLSGEVVPIDGKLLTPAVLDESALTGEPYPVAHDVGEDISSGVVNSGHTLELTATSTSEHSTYSNLIRLVKQASADSADSVRLANRWAVWFIPFTLVVAASVLFIGQNQAAAVAVLIAATPCPLILAIPVAVISGMSKSSARGALIKGGKFLELLATAKTVMLDKTGTLTRGGAVVTTIETAPGVDSSELALLAASIEQHSPHPVARALVDYAEMLDVELATAEQITEEHGHQISGTVLGKRIVVGQPELPLPEWSKTTSALLVSIKVDGTVLGVYGLDDPLRDDAIETIQNLRKLGIEKIVLVSGDREETANLVGLEIGADEIHARCTPETKLQIVNQERSSTSGSVLLVGDGINDAPALAAASVGIAMGARGATAASEAADVVIIEDSIKHLASAIDISKAAFTKAKQAAGVGMGLAIGAMFGAALGIFNATESAILQELIDASAILWALTPLALKLKKEKH